MIRYVVAVTHGAGGGCSAHGPFFSLSAAQRWIDASGYADIEILPLNEPEVPPRTSAAEVEHLNDGGHPISQWAMEPPVAMPPHLAQVVSAMSEAMRNIRIPRPGRPE